MGLAEIRLKKRKFFSSTSYVPFLSVLKPSAVLELNSDQKSLQINRTVSKSVAKRREDSRVSLSAILLPIWIPRLESFSLTASKKKRRKEKKKKKKRKKERY